MGNLFQELKRRNVFRVATAYVVFSWLVIQITDTLSDPLGLPEWTLNLLLLLLLLGFPIAVVFSWVFELTGEGLKKTEEVKPGDSLVTSTGRKLNLVIIATLVVSLGYFVWESRLSDRGQPDTASIEPVPAATITAVITDKSIAVLPFADFSPDSDQAWFADGLSEEILNSLVRTADLKVSSRTSSFAYRDSALEIPAIATELGVAHILEGSVRRSETRLRITAQLIRAADGFHLWSENYDRSPDDAIAIQEDLAMSISMALQTAMDPAALAAMQEVGTDSVSAYNAYLEGLSYEPRCLNIVSPLCIAAYEQAVELDPEFAEAWFRLASIWRSHMSLTTILADLGMSQAEFTNRFRDDISLAISHATNEVDLLKYRAELAAVQMRLRDQRDLLQEYLTQRPNDFQALRDIIALETLFDPASALSRLYRFMDLRGPDNDASVFILMYAYRLGAYDTVRSEAQRVLQEAPTNASLLYQAHRALLWAGNVDEAATSMRLFNQTSGVGGEVELYPGDVDDRRRIVALRQACAEGREEDAAEIYANGFDNVSTEWHALMVLGRDEEAVTLLKQYDLPETVLQLFSWAVYPQFDPRPFPYLMAVLEREGIEPREVRPIPYACTEQQAVEEVASF